MSSEDKLSSKREVNWFFVIINLQCSLFCLLGLYFIVYEAYISTTLFCFLLVLLSVLGVYAGAHRLWAHKSYEATTSLRVFLMLCQTLSGHTSIYNWVRLHRLHHKYFKTDLDPFNPSKGFLFSHFIANSRYISAAQEKALEEIDMSDLEADNIVMFQNKYYWFLFCIISVLLPINAPAEYWDETILTSFIIAGVVRLAVAYNLSLLIHSALTVFDLSYNNSLDSNIVFFINKSYWISYHYLTPWDYQTSELGKYGTDCTSKFIRVCAALELASDLKTVSSEIVKNALAESVDTQMRFAECLSKSVQNIEPDHYLAPAKFH